MESSPLQRQQEGMEVIPSEIQQTGMEAVLPSVPISQDAIIHNRRDLGKRFRRWSFISVALLVVITLAVVLPTTIRRKHSRPSPSPTSSVPTPSSLPLPDSGIYDNTGIAALGSEDGTGGFHLFYQHQSGQIRFATYRSGGWFKDNPSNIVTKDARNGTALAGIGYVENSTHYMHILFVDVKSNLQETIYDNITNIWSPGSLGGRWPVPKVRRIALGGCYTPLWGQPDGSPETLAPSMGIQYGSTNYAIQQLCWRPPSGWVLCWVRGDFNPTAGATCTYSSNRGSISNIWLQNVRGNGLQQVWYEHDPNNPDNNTAFEVWNGVTYTDMKFGSAIGVVSYERLYHYVYIQNTADTVIEVDIMGEARETRVRNTTGIDRGLPDTWIASIVEPLGSADKDIHLFFQTQNGKITQFVRGIEHSVWVNRGFVPL
ncbi:hypothetical protein FGG08_006607 [Glutinoglossum americanum]|uniref:Fucose-specific lectin n=1 Tax=Glutinoglossum americanum TaxID=1670608 RepID=A0A9P8HSC1_9PEZI|nr:hypothetical protein FGG08_006607 [Glutinoglossum americanum]